MMAAERVNHQVGADGKLHVPLVLLPYSRPSDSPAATETIFFNAPHRLTPATCASVSYIPTKRVAMVIDGSRREGSLTSSTRETLNVGVSAINITHYYYTRTSAITLTKQLMPHLSILLRPVADRRLREFVLGHFRSDVGATQRRAGYAEFVAYPIGEDGDFVTFDVDALLVSTLSGSTLPPRQQRRLSGMRKIYLDQRHCFDSLILRDDTFHLL